MNLVTLNNNVKMPILGFGVFQITDAAECEQAVLNMPDRLVDLLLNNETPPAVNQVEVNPFCQRSFDQEIMEQKSVQIQSWGPFAEGRNGLFENDVLKRIAQKHSRSVAQIVLRRIAAKAAFSPTKTPPLSRCFAG